MLSRLSSNDVLFVLRTSKKNCHRIGLCKLKITSFAGFRGQNFAVILVLPSDNTNKYLFFGNFVQCCFELCLSHNFYWELIVLALLRGNVKQNLYKIKLSVNKFYVICGLH